MIFTNQVVVVLLIALASSSFFKPSRKLVFLDQSFVFYYDELGFMKAEGVWKLSDKKHNMLPHVVKIKCNKHERSCTKSEIYIVPEGKMFETYLLPRKSVSYIVSDDVDFEITQWTNNKIIASYSGVTPTGELSCFASTLIIDILKQSIKIIANPTSEFCKAYQGLGGYSVTGELVDGRDLYIEIDNEMIWNQQK